MRVFLRKYTGPDSLVWWIMGAALALGLAFPTLGRVLGILWAICVLVGFTRTCWITRDRHSTKDYLEIAYLGIWVCLWVSAPVSIRTWVPYYWDLLWDVVS